VLLGNEICLNVVEDGRQYGRPDQCGHVRVVKTPR